MATTLRWADGQPVYSDGTVRWADGGIAHYEKDAPAGGGFTINGVSGAAKVMGVENPAKVNDVSGS